MTRMRITFEIDIPDETNRREFDAHMLHALQSAFGSLVYAATEKAEEHTLRRRPKAD